ncbi:MULTISPECIES: hypothetical protein [unclassified Exiguobacterium]|uniref:hypothetical protein n=1 Tax=unclassified Exiguobacterium TaxID=2644629 RepID=UPI001BE8F3B4|nr:MULTISPECIES: hypothetical protein [unclassified Exiguobacterium]
MGKLNFLLAEDYIKPKIYFRSKASENSINFSKVNKNNFYGLDHLSQMLLSSSGFIVNAFQVDYYQLLPKLIIETLSSNQIHKKLYIVGPELSLSIIKRGLKTNYDKHFYNFHYLGIEEDQDGLFNHCLNLLKEGHIVYVLPEASFHWKPSHLRENQYNVIPLCSSFLSQSADVPVLTTSLNDDSKIVLFEPSYPNDYNGCINKCIEQQCDSIYQLLKS